MPHTYIRSSANISEDKKYRYELSRTWDDALPSIAFILLNPSTADADIDDRTVEHCVEYARRWGYGTVSMYNLYAYRTTYPEELEAQGFPVGPQNDEILKSVAATGVRIIVAWGNNARAERIDEVMAIIGRPVECLGINKNGSPKHPARLPYNLQPQAWPYQARIIQQ
ncbi:DUF1643 domain-containing protein [Bifidobacterium imperatoris]|uniref:DUF1643 domain-containing protein n=1 Tax=Bifidobacterium imperatoris TaxID=2020965 RepID=A0A2N5ISB6_9BIFI|nr:DUF1643 domain-containing protein [Bifidobacterium imperatoris]PLS24837.1 hypothetical protein Tam1G_1165 [Bifidobacterium imperatoris]QSY57949.1 DUF1643 domain-containing protein [Bifidobacterium imperatoris]